MTLSHCEICHLFLRPDETCPHIGIIPPAFFDDGDGNEWADALRFVHFKVSDYAGRQLPDGSGSLAPVSFPHDNPDSLGGQHDHA